MSLINLKVLKKVAAAYAQRRLGRAIYSRIRPFLKGAKYLLYDPSSRRVKLHRPAYVKPDEKDRKLVERIFAAFGKMKKDQKTAGPFYQPSSLWEAQLKSSYSYLLLGLEENNIEKFHFFLANFGAWKEYTGVEESMLIQRYAADWSLITRKYLQNEVFFNLLKLWEFYSIDKNISRLARPACGNLAGAYIDGVLVTVDSFFGEIYGGLLSGLSGRFQRPVIAELGGGGGRLAYYTVRDKAEFTYIDFDLPEVLCLASYYLMKAFPSKKTLLYGEQNYKPSVHKGYDFIFMPSFEIAKLEPFCVDLFINETSLGEMAKDAADNYIRYITKSSRYFFHMNHDHTPNIYDDKTCGLLGSEYLIPDDKFTLIFRYPELKHLLFNAGQVDLDSDIFVYLYERKSV